MFLPRFFFAVSISLSSILPAKLQVVVILCIPIVVSYLFNVKNIVHRQIYTSTVVVLYHNFVCLKLNYRDFTDMAIFSSLFFYCFLKTSNHRPVGFHSLKIARTMEQKERSIFSVLNKKKTTFKKNMSEKNQTNFFPTSSNYTEN
jgi:hypothetical protein